MTSFIVDEWRVRIGVYGVGYVGAAVADAFSTVADVCVRDPRLAASASIDVMASADVLFICVPTPEGRHGVADLGQVRGVVHELARVQARGVVVVKSTVPPGSTEQLAADYPALAICSSPEFLRERQAQSDFERPHRIILGWSRGLAENACAVVRAVYRLRFPSVPVVEMTATEAELTKYASNAFFAVKVSLANELAELAAATDASWDTVRSALGMDPRIGSDHLAVPGPDGAVGYGGRCLPKDVAALLYLADQLSVDVPVLESARAANARRRSADGDSKIDAPSDGDRESPDSSALAAGVAGSLSGGTESGAPERALCLTIPNG